MSHTTLRSGYTELVERLNRFPQGAPPSDTLYKILQILFSEREAQLVANLPIKPFTAEKASQVWKMDLTETRKVLDELSSRAILVDIEWDGKTIHKETKGFVGKECTSKTKFIEDALGTAEDRRFKSEYYESGEKDQERDRLKN